MLKNNEYANTPPVNRINFTESQPFYSSLHNCTAIFMHTAPTRYPWMTIPCDEIFDASYICQPLHSQTRSTLTASIQANSTCDGNWLLLERSETCLLLIDVVSDISYHDSHYICSSQNASVLQVNTSDRVYSAQESKEIRNRLEYMYNMIRNTFMYKIFQNTPTVDLLNMLYGRYLEQNSKYIMISRLLYWGRQSTPRNISYFANFNDTCTILEYSTSSYNYYVGARQMRGWGVKCRPCAEVQKVAGVICEKPANQITIHCQNNYFECHDKTCVLVIYKCDYIPDCFDGSDEANCAYDMVTISTEQFVNLPCVLLNKCDVIIDNKVRIQTLCDGILQSNSTLVNEEDLCEKINNWPTKFMPITSSIQTKYRPKDNFLFQHSSIKYIFAQEFKYRCGGISNSWTARNSTPNTTINLTRKLFPEIRQAQSILLKYMCRNKIIHGRYIKWRRRAKHICQAIACPGMFKCQDYFCVSLSAVCDNKNDCDLGEDETVCSRLTCPGFLKCRAEERCIATNEICDRNINCFHSMDDELGCHDCPINCYCQGYVMSCHVNNSMHIIESEHVLYAKALLLKGIQYNFCMDHVQFVGLLLMNISFCEIKDVNISHVNTSLLSILIVDLKHNQLTDSSFLFANVFKRIIFLDMSFNLLTVFKFGRRRFQYLSVLLLSGNNLHQIELKLDESTLTFLDLQFIFYSTKLAVFIYPNAYIIFTIKVSESLLCCVLPEKVKCLSVQKQTKCFGLIERDLLKISFYCLSLLSLSLTSAVLIKNIVRISKRKLHQKSNHYSIMLMSQSIANNLSSLYLIALSIADFLNVDLLTFKTGGICTALNAVLYISLEILLVFKAGSVLVLVLKIKFPFKHQCPWFKWIIPASGFAWLFITVTYVIHILLFFLVQKQYYFDNLCSIGWCDINVDFTLLHVMVYIIDSASIITFIISFTNVYTSLKRHRREIDPATVNNPYTVTGVTCKLIFRNLVEIIFRYCMLGVLSAQLAKLYDYHLCLYFFLYALPVTILYSSFVHLFQ